jgi:hypothetical protein
MAGKPSRLDCGKRLNLDAAMAKIANHLRTFAIAVLTLLASTGFDLATEAL